MRHFARRPSDRWFLLAVTLTALSLTACGDDDDDDAPPTTPTAEGTGETPAVAEPAGPLLHEAGELADGDASDARGHYDRYFVEVEMGARLFVELRSTAFDPVLEVTLPGGGTMVNDDWRGDRAHSRVELIAPANGQMKVEVRGYATDGRGAYQLSVQRADAAEGAPVLTAGQSHDGELTESDAAHDGGERYDTLVVQVSSGATVTVTGQGGAAAPSSTLVGPAGLPLRGTNGTYAAHSAGAYTLQVSGAPGLRYRVSVTAAGGLAATPVFARTHHQFDPGLPGATPTAAGAEPAAPAPTPLPIRVGDRLNGNLAAGDATLPSGEFNDVYLLEVTAPAGDATISLESSAFDPFLRVEGPGGQHWENDDHAGTLNSRVVVPLRQPGTYRIAATSYRPGETGAYELKVLAARDGAVATGGATPPSTGGAAATDQRIEGELAQGDSQLQSGEFMDEHTFEWTAGSRVHLEVQSEAFDTYVIVHPPNGPQQDNDDMTPGESLNAGLDLQVGETGTWRVVVTSYQPGMTGAYALVIRGGAGGAAGTPTTPTQPEGTPTTPTAPPAAGARTETGSLAQGDSQLSSGEFVDRFPMTFTARSAVSIRLESSDFDSYLMVRSPSGHQEDNDDFQSGALHAGLDIPVAEPGNYEIMVTSYRPGEVGDYRLTVTEGASVVSPGPTPNNGGGGGGGAAPSGRGGNVYGLFAGITDYPGTSNDLPECANDARKLAEAVRNQGNMPPDQEFLLTDSQATVANIRQAMQTVASRIQPNDVFIFFYSGHGGQTDTSSDPRELDSRDEYLFVYDGQIMDDEMGRLFDQIHARVSLVALDACFAGGFAKDVITQPGRVGMFSSEEDVTSAVAGNFQAGGYLSHFLRLGIGGEADNDPGNQVLTVGELTHYTWRQFGQHASDVRMSMGYQHLVVDRGAVHTSEVLWAVRR